MAAPLVRAKDMKVHYPLFKGFLQRLFGGGRLVVRALDGVSFEVRRGEIFGLVGESGCGKSTAGRALMGLTPITDGEIVLEFPEEAAGREERVRPLGLRLVCLAWWAAAAVHLADAAGFALTGSAFLPLGLMASTPGIYLALVGGAATALAGLGLALWMLQPWSRRPARVVAGINAILAFAIMPWGLFEVAMESAIVAYLGTPGPVGLLRRSGWLVPATRFTLRKEGVLEGAEDDEDPPWSERWLLGPRAVKTAGLSWVLKQLRAKVQIVYQDPHAAMSPGMTIGESIGHALRAHGTSTVAGAAAGSLERSREPAREDVRASALRLLEDVGLRPPEQFHDRLSTELSGGQKQRAVIARALAPRPLLLVADEPVALLDMSIRAMVLDLLLDLKRRYGLTYVFITHDLATAKLVCDRIAIMYLGRIVEMGEASRIYADPKHPYTKALLDAIPIPDPARRRTKVLPKGEVPDAVFPPAGCRFHPRCPVALPSCGWEGRDFLEYLEERRLDPATLAAEEEAFGEIPDWSAEGPLASRKLPPEKAEALATRVREALEEAPVPLRKAVASVGVEGDYVRIRFRPPAVLAPKEVEGRTVECLLY